MTDMSGDKIYWNFQHGDGPEGLVSCAAIVKDIARDYNERAGQIRALVGRMEAAWQGDAAQAAQRGAGPMATEHELAGHALGTAQDLTGRQAGSFDEAKNRVVPVPPKPEPENPAAVFTNLHAGVDHEHQVDEYNAAAQNNVDVMNGYSGASDYNTTNLPASYGDLSDDQAGISVNPASTIDSSDFGDNTGRDTGRDPGRDTGRDTGGSSGGDPAPGPDQAAPRGPGAATPGPGGALSPDPGATTPGAFTPGGPGGPGVSPVDATAGRTTGGAPASGLGVVAGPGGEPGPGRGGSGGGVGGSPRGGGVGGGGSRGAGPRAEILAGPRAGAEPHGSPVRPGAATGMVGGAGRGAAPAGGMPMGGAGRSRDGEDTERKRPEWLEGGDPDDLFDTDVLTAPPTIGAEDD